MQSEDDFKSVFTFPITSSLFDDIKHKILSPLSCLREFDSHWMLELDLPLVDKKDIEITMDGNTVNVEAKLKEKYEEKIGSLTEFEYFKKSISLPGKIDNEKTSAKFQKGRLEIKIPKIMIGHSVKIT